MLDWQKYDIRAVTVMSDHGLLWTTFGVAAVFKLADFRPFHFPDACTKFAEGTPSG